MIITICFQYCAGKEPYMQYGCIFVNEIKNWQIHFQKCLQQYYIQSGLLKKNEYMDIELYDNNVIMYDHQLQMFPTSYQDYNLFIDTTNDYFIYNGSKYDYEK
jgi:hypothetical protein